MALNLPANFKRDIQGRDTALVPFVIIGNLSVDYVWDRFYFISTNQMNLGAAGLDSDGEAMGDRISLPILLNIPSLKESIDIESRNYKISNVTLDISNFPYNGERFSELVGSNSLINTECRIYWASPSTTSHSLSENLSDADAMPIYNGKIRRYTHDDEKVKLVVEDISQATLHMDLPLPENYLTGDDVPDKYKNKPIPMVYGHVDRSPCVAIADGGSLNIFPDLETSSSKYVDADLNPLLLHNNDDYVAVMKEFEMSEWKYSENIQYSVINNNKIVLKNALPEGTISAEEGEPFIVSPLDEDKCAVLLEDYPDKYQLYTGNHNIHFGAWGIDVNYAATNIGEQVHIYGLSTEYQMYRLKHIFNNLDNVVGNSTNENATDRVYLKWTIKYNIDITGIHNGHIAYLEGFQGDEQLPNNPTEGGFTIKEYSNSDSNTPDHNDSTEIEVVRDWISSDQSNKYNSIVVSLHAKDANSFYGQLEISSILRAANYLIDNFYSQDYYANVNGRLSLLTALSPTGVISPTVPRTILDILNTELGQSIEYESEIEGDYFDTDVNLWWQYAFTVDKKINSKKLIEGIASASPYIPRFDNMGNFKFDVIELSYSSSDHTIKEADVIDFSFSRTKIEDVVTKIEFKYKWDYARSEFSKARTLTIDNFACFSENAEMETFSYYGLPDTHIESTLVIDDRGKYIRDDATAERFVCWMMSWYANQHITMKVKLPLSVGLKISIADILEFDYLLGGIAPYGIDYTGSTTLNFQKFYPYFMVTETNKRLDYVEITCIQMHELWAEKADSVVDGNMEYLTNVNIGCSAVVDENGDTGDTNDTDDIDDGLAVCGGYALGDANHDGELSCADYVAAHLWQTTGLCNGWDQNPDAFPEGCCNIGLILAGGGTVGDSEGGITSGDVNWLLDVLLDGADCSGTTGVPT